MDIGSGIAAGSGILGSVAVAFKLIAIVSNKPNGNGNGTNGHCKDHSGVCTAIDDFNAWLTKIENKLDRVIERRELPR
jgi:hypothetical protein